MSKIDRLSALMARFELSVTPCPPERANFWILQDQCTRVPGWLIMGKLVPIEDAGTERVRDVVASAQVLWGGPENPLLAALPTQVVHPLAEDEEMRALVSLFVAELKAARCGVASVLNRLGEVLIVRLMRAQIESGTMEQNLLAALADPRLSRAVVAMHDRPQKIWRLETLAAEAGLSVSRFSDLFRKTVGVTPLAYLRRWRLILARQDIEKGERIQRVASRYCYGSAEALSRAISSTYGQTPMQLRKSALQPDQAY